jgi:signal transduction histidine kinase
LESRQFEAYNQFSTFVVHDLKNLIAQLSLLVSNATRHRNNPEFLDDAVETIDHSIDKMQRLLSQIRRGGLPDTTTAIPVDLCDLAESVAERQAQRHPAPIISDCRNGLTIKAEAGRL